MNEPTLCIRRPPDFSEVEIQDFIAMTLAGDEVADNVLEENVRCAQSLIVVRHQSCLVAIAALKNPKGSYRKKVQTKTGVAISAKDYPFELGYLFVLPSARGQGIGLMLCEAALSVSEGNGVFATARTNNDAMNAILPRFNFLQVGKPYASTRGGHTLRLFLRIATRQKGE